jgi:ABC-type transporter Mla maintaining outer membrane lipid asymmetry permease subunit MlaE
LYLSTRFMQSIAIRWSGKADGNTVPSYQRHFRRINAMNIAKHMEAVLLAALAIVAATGIATAAVPAHQSSVNAGANASANIVAAAPVSGPMQVVTIVGKRQPRG